MSGSADVKEIRAGVAAARKLKDRAQAIVERHAARTKERERAWSAGGSRDETLAHVDRLVDAECSRWRANHAAVWVSQLLGHREMKYQGLGTSNERSHENVTRPRLPMVHGILSAPGALTFSDLCGLMPSLMKTALTEMISAAPDERFGLPASQREPRLAELDAEITALKQEHEELQAAAAGVGIELPALKTVPR